MNLLEVFKLRIRVFVEQNVPLWMFNLSQRMCKKIERLQKVSLYVLLGKNVWMSDKSWEPDLTLSLSHSEQLLFSCLGSKVTVNSRKLQCFFGPPHHPFTLTCYFRCHRAGSQLKMHTKIIIAACKCWAWIHWRIGETKSRKNLQLKCWNIKTIEKCSILICRRELEWERKCWSRAGPVLGVLCHAWAELSMKSSHIRFNPTKTGVSLNTMFRLLLL